MYRWANQEPYDYVAYIDESGDTGLKAVKPLDPQGSSEWLVIGAYVVQRENEREIPGWVNNITQHFRGHQRYGFHFVDLNPAKKRAVCAAMATYPIRVFVIASNKKNMKGYHNPWASQLPSNNWFYCWLTRLLLERITHFVYHHSIRRYGSPRKIKLEYSNRGGLSYGQMDAYYTWLRYRSSAGQLVLPLGDLYWDVMDPSLLEVYAYESRAGLHLADAVAGSFFKAVDRHDTRACDPQFARLLEPRMARWPDSKRGQISGYGLKLMPNWKIARLSSDQAAIFRAFGYPKQWWAPAPNNP
jgi:hypothetical protein